MKKYNWSVEVFSPHNLDECVFYTTEETLEKCVNKWREKCNNDYINYHKLHNIYHNRNKIDNLLIKVHKVEV